MIRPICSFSDASKIASRPRLHSATRAASSIADHRMRRITTRPRNRVPAPRPAERRGDPSASRDTFRVAEPDKSWSVAMPVTVVVGAQWGDEGKAKVIDLLAADAAYVVRYQGGHNAGHTVVVGDERYALQLVPSGVLYPHIVPVIGNGVVVDMPTLFKEIDTLEGRGISCAKLKVSSAAHLIFPWHQTLDALFEQVRGDSRIGTTLKGIGPTYADKARREGIRAGEVLDPAGFAAAVKAGAVAHNIEIIALGGEALDVDALVEQFGSARRPAGPVRHRHRRPAARRARRRRPAAAGGRPGDVPRPRPRRRIRSSPRPTRPPAGRASAPGSGRATSTASSGSPRRTPPASAPGRSRPSCSTSSATRSSTSARSSARSPAAAGAPAGSTA